MNNRFKFRAWDIEDKKYREVIWLGIDITLLNEIGYVKNETQIFEQCTGLRDKNGKLIYEGDILEDEESKISYVVWADWILGFVLRSPGSEAEESEINGYFTETAVIGNIHENPELLEEEIK